MKIVSVLSSASRGVYSIPHAAMQLKSLAQAGAALECSIETGEWEILELAEDDRAAAVDRARELWPDADPYAALAEAEDAIRDCEVAMDGITFRVAVSEGLDILLVSDEVSEEEAARFLAEHSQGFFAA